MTGNNMDNLTDDASPKAGVPTGNGVVAWMPIETAPKDGTRVLLHYVYKNFTKIGAWDAGCRYWAADQWFHERPPTHWMHLPAPPATQRGER